MNDLNLTHKEWATVQRGVSTIQKECGGKCIFIPTMKEIEKYFNCKINIYNERR